jgi:deazaflavin-dependent oxidoreductase (nitroreductase family)
MHSTIVVSYNSFPQEAIQDRGGGGLATGGTMPAPKAPAGVAAWAARLLRVRWIVRAPIRLYRARLGFIFGSRLLMLEHTGRKTGIRRYVVLEVVSHPDPGTYLVAAGFGNRAQWLRNVSANPSVRVQIGSRRPAAATAHLLTSQEAAAALTDYAGRHPRAWAKLRTVFETTLGAGIGADGTSLPMVAVKLDGGPDGRTPDGGLPA